ncbi:hypothetical protein FO519_004232 [Halicephalobus sp. NKZ332]|nr:hypothetical protein FO519_004232 [Halicephalobus sp. NKZ332]
MWCFCGGGDKCFCHLKYVIYKLKCKKCFQTYIGKTKRELWIRIKEHLRAIKNGKGSALARHECRGDYDIRVLARAENNSQALGIMEGKMMNKDSCKPDEKPRKNRDNDDFDDEFEYWIEESEFLSSEVEHEDENGDMSETEANKKIGGEERMSFNANNYVLLAAIEAHKNNKPFITLDLSSDEAVN